MDRSSKCDTSSLIRPKGTQTDASEILPWLLEGYFGQKAILEHLTLLVRWSEEANEELPAMLFTGVHGQGQRVLAKLVAENCGMEYVDIELGEDENAQDLDSTLGPVRDEQERSLLFIEASPPHPSNLGIG